MSSIFAGKPIEIESVVFREPVITISYMEKRKQNEKVAITETIHINFLDDLDSIKVIVAELLDLIDNGQVSLRNPPRKLSPVERLAEGLPYEEEGEEDVDQD